MGLPYKALRSLLFAYADLCGDQEKAHVLAMHGVDLMCSSRRLIRAIDWLYNDERIDLRCNVGGITFQNPFGIAAGLIKYPRLLPFFAALSPGFATIGTFTPKDQGGNLRPRLFRSTSDGALLNRLGFPNPGAEEAGSELGHVDVGEFPIFGSIGANKKTVDSGNIEMITADYVTVFTVLYPHVSAVEVNVSSPNTEGLRELMKREKLGRILGALRATERELAPNSKRKLILVKGTMDLVPDDHMTYEAPEAVADLIEVCEEHDCGITWGNTTSNVQWRPETLKKMGGGGLSGQPLYLHTIAGIEMIRSYQEKHHFPRRPLIATGGIWGAWEALSALSAGADLFGQLTPFIYEGPLHFWREKQEFRKLLSKSGLSLRQNGASKKRAA